MDFPYFMKILTKGRHMKKKLLVLLIAVIPTLMPNLVFAVAIDLGEEIYCTDGKGNTVCCSPSCCTCVGVFALEEAACPKA